MLIRKLFKFENAHIVRGCSSERCRASIHGHSYEIEVLFESNFLDHGQMVFDFGLMKQSIKDLIDSFDHAITIWDGDDQTYIADMKKHSDRWVQLPVSPSAEQFSRVIFIMVDKMLSCTTMINGEKEVTLHSIIVHETMPRVSERMLIMRIWG
jgi:6-pyruvoyltetrahydropterin/6-carboxytetrahydropterin synthase